MTESCGLSQQDLDIVVSVLSEYHQIEEAIIFGSRAKGNFKAGSDVDIAIKGLNLNLDVISQISFTLNEESVLPYKFDILNFHTISSSDLVEHINRVGIIFYKSGALLEII